MIEKLSGFFYARREAALNTTDTAMATIQKLFYAIQAGNIGAAILAFINVIPVFAPMITVLFAVWVGVLAAKAKQREIKSLDLDIKLKEKQLMIHETQGNG